MREYVACLRKKPEVEDIYLCGSWARGSYTPYSDVDLLILVKGDGQKPHDRIPAYLPDRFPVSLDLFIYTREELEKSSFARKLLADAVRI